MFYNFRLPLVSVGFQIGILSILADLLTEALSALPRPFRRMLASVPNPVPGLPPEERKGRNQYMLSNRVLQKNQTRKRTCRQHKTHSIVTDQSTALAAKALTEQQQLCGFADVGETALHPPQGN